MVVCRFFQQGYCRYGQNCRFEHIYGSKYTYHANPAPQVAPTQPAGCTDEQLVNQVQADMQSALRGGQWILSCYAPYKEKPIFPGISDLSPEEARLFIYEAKCNNTIDQAITYMNNLYKETRQKYEQLLQPNINIIKVLRSLYKGETIESPFSNTAQSMFGAANNAPSNYYPVPGSGQSFQATSQNSDLAASIFSQGQNSIFNTQPDPAKELFSKANNTSIFGQNAALGVQNQNSQAKSIFETAVQNTNQQSPSNLFSTANKSIFGSPPTHNTSPFGQAQNISPFGQAQNNMPFGQAQNNSPFGQAQTNMPFGQGQNSSPFGQAQNASPFGQSQNSTPFGQANVFQKTENPTSIFGQVNNQFNTSNDPGVYSKIEDLSEVDLEAFKSNRFELGFVPELPPPHELCNPGL